MWRLLVTRGAGEEQGIVVPGPGDQGVPVAAVREVDGAVLRRAQRGDHDAFHEIVDHYEGRLRVLAYGLLRDADQMNDALQDTFVKAWAALPEFRREAALGTWLHRICYRVCLDHLRRQRVRPAGETLVEDLADPADEAEGLALREQVSEALGRLPVEQRAVLLLVDREGYDYGTVAEALEVPVGTVASRLSLARAAMRRALRLDESGEEATR
jgi:RNA polymerase sigma-70 factor (ECF subfamily)